MPERTGDPSVGDALADEHGRRAALERRVDGAFDAVPRAPFLPRHLRPRADEDGPLPLGHGSTCSQPRTVRDMLLLLDARPGQHALDVGSGSGWTTALLAHLVSPGGAVVGVELEEPLVAASRTTLARLGLLAETEDDDGVPDDAVASPAPGVAVRVEAAVPGVLGWPAEGPYDRILVSAQATGRDVPESLLAQLAPTGVLVAPVSGSMVVVDQRDGERRVTRHGAYRFVPLRETRR